VRRYQGGVGTWIASTGTGYTWGIGLDEAPPGSGNIDLIPATASIIGGVSVVARSATQGLDLTAAGALSGPLATNLLAGTLLEPPPDGLQYVRSRSTAGASTWQPATAANYIWGIGIDESTATPGTINLMPAKPLPGEIGGINEPPADDTRYVRLTSLATGLSSWQALSAAPPLTWGIGIDITGIDVNLQPANFTPGEIGGITSAPRSLTQGLLLDEPTGLLTGPLATDLLAGSIVEPPPDGLSYARKRDVAGVSAWAPVTAVFIGDAPPPAPVVGQLWYESDTGKLFLFVQDANSSQFVQVGGP
jgi:hypothetical protein